MKRLLLIAIITLFSSAMVSAQNANVRYSGNARPGDTVYSCSYDGFVNMRQSPSFKASIVGKFKNGPQGAILIQHIDQWMKIKVGGLVGYVPSRFVQDEPTVAYTGTVSADWLQCAWYGTDGIYCIFNNGYWIKNPYWDVEDDVYGYYIMENNSVKLIMVGKGSENGGISVTPRVIAELDINKSEKKIGDWTRMDEEGYGDDSDAELYGEKIWRDKKDICNLIKSLIR